MVIWNHLLVASAVVLVVVAIDHPEELVNLLAGSFTDGDRFSTGNTLPLVGRPWGFNHWAPQTKDGSRHTGSWWFKGSDHQFTWLRCTHQPSPWIGDWGWFLFSPQIGQLTRSPVHYWEPRGAVLKPYLLDATVAPYGIRMELAPTDHGAYLRVTFPPNSASGDHDERHICFAEARWEGSAEGTNSADGTGRFFEGRATQVNSDRMLVTNFALHLRTESPEATRIVHQDDMKCFAYAQSATVVHVRIATSLVSAAQALVNLRRELRPGKTFDAVALDAKMVWNKMLKRVDVVDAGDVSDAANRHLDIFYTGLYRALTFPRRIDEVDEKSNVIHYSPYDPHGGIHDGPLVTDNGFWDTFRTVYPLLSLVYPDHLGTIVQGWLNAYREGGWLPSWASPGYRNCMVGTFADVVVADAVVKGVPGFDLMLAKDALLKDSFSEPPAFSGGSVGKSGLRQYEDQGFFNANTGGGDAVSRTLDYGFADFSTAQALRVLADKLGAADSSLEKELRQHSDTLQKRAVRAYTSLFDKRQGLMVPKGSGGQVSPSFAPIEWGRGYVEGNAWHHSFPPYALVSATTAGASAGPTLVDLYGSKQELLVKLHQLLVIPSSFRVGSYNQEIHEMTEMRALAMGQYGHNNQPSHHILYLFALLGDAATTQSSVRQVMERAYGRDFYAGDEDNGEQGAWYVLSALGLYVTTPGTTEYVLGSPVFRHVRISRSPETYDAYYEASYEQRSAAADAAAASAVVGPGAARHLDIIALGTGPGSVYVDQVTLNNAPLAGATVDDAPLQQDGILRFIMRGEENSHDIEHRVQEVHLTSTPQLEARLRSTSTSAVQHEDQEEARKYLKMEHDLQASVAAIADLNQQITVLRGGKVPAAVLPALLPAPRVVSGIPTAAPAETASHGLLYRVFQVLLWAFVAVEALDFLFFLTTPVPGAQAGSSDQLSALEGGSASVSGANLSSKSASAGAVGQQPPAGAEAEDFELVNSAHSSSSTTSGGGAEPTATHPTSVAGAAAGASSLSLDDFASPMKVPAALQGRYSPFNPAAQASSSGSSIASHYLANRRYGRGACAFVLVFVYLFGQIFSEIYWRVYFCSFGRRPRGAVGTETLAGFVHSNLYSAKKGRKQVAHTV